MDKEINAFLEHIKEAEYIKHVHLTLDTKGKDDLLTYKSEHVITRYRNAETILDCYGEEEDIEIVQGSDDEYDVESDISITGKINIDDIETGITFCQLDIKPFIEVKTECEEEKEAFI